MVELGARLRVPGVSHERLRNHGIVLRLVMTQVCTDCPGPVDVGLPGPARTLRAVQRAPQSLTCVVLQASHEVVYNIADYLTGRFQGLAGNRGTQRDEIGDKMDVGLQR